MMNNSRPTKQAYYLELASIVLKRGTCLRRNYGAIIVRDDQIISTGYTGSSRGEINCCDVGYCPREEANIPSGERYELCKSVHAEMNAIIHAGRERCKGATIYVVGRDMKTGEILSTPPCSLCQRAIVNAGIELIVTYSEEELCQRMSMYRE
jgi:dCMP deaminase